MIHLESSRVGARMGTSGSFGCELLYLLVRAALEACRQPRVRVLIGGLGVGFSLDEALRHPAVTEVAVIEVEEAIIRWHATHFGAHASTALEDPRTRVVNADLPAWLADGADQFDAI